MKIEKIRLSTLRNSAHFQYHSEFKKLVDRESAMVLKVDKLFADYLALYNNLNDGLKQINKSAITEKIAEADKARVVNASDECPQPDPNMMPPSSPGSFGNPNTLTTNGIVKAGINIYPFNNKGELFEPGVYTALIKMNYAPYEGCVNIGGSAVMVESSGWWQGCSRMSLEECYEWCYELQLEDCINSHHFYVEEIEWNKTSTEPNACKEKLMNDKKPIGDKDGESPILSQVNSNSLGIGVQIYYNLQGISLGATKPTTSGIYVEKIGNSAKRILVK